MVFSSLTFLCLFLPVFLLVYNISGKLTYKNIVLVLFSLFFYAWGEPIWILALLASGTTDYICGRVIDKHSNGKGRKIALVASLIINLGLLGTFKYSGFIIENINALLGTSIKEPAFNLPLGISFYTFQTLSYTIDMYRGEIRVQKSFLSFMCYVSMFPQLVAGPIVRYSEVEKEVYNRKVTLKGFSEGVTRFSIGLAKKTLLANPAGAAAAMLLSDASKLTATTAWLGAFLYGYQVYFDFSGYSDMAIGIGKMIGFTFPENFNYPFECRSVTDFWRRWHISLSSFFRDYLYIPLGGNKRFTARNIAIVWILTGIWHGAAWNYLYWGVYYGIFLLFERYVFGKALAKLPALFGRLYGFLAILGSWGIFFYPTAAERRMYYKAFFMIDTPLSSFLPESILMSHIWLIVVLVIAASSAPKRLYKYMCEFFPRLSLTEPFYAAGCILTSFLMLLGQTYNPFLYFRF
ncbi:MAG: MBOAT family protein [Oscillospiraceae bacterium]|nr:MBOAT family protein [Oscillospiraceae bacterium]